MKDGAAYYNAMLSGELGYHAVPAYPADRFGVRRLFDFLRGVDGLIWTIILSRAFGPGPMTGALAMLITDVGSFGKTFSEALENIDEKQVEGIRSTGANAVQRARFGIQPQVTEWQGGAQGRGTRPLALREAGLVRQAGLRAFEWTFPRSRPHPLPAMLAVGAGLLRAMQARLDYRCGGSAGIGPASRAPGAGEV